VSASFLSLAPTTTLTLFLRWVTQRQVFGKPLHSQAVIRAKLAAMISRVESAQNWLESVTYQMNHMKYKDQAEYLAG
jgi:alkylation response protein AidB-like acyl-CoA dehydrogenase